MIRLLQGQIISKEERALTLLTQGVGYHIHVPRDILAVIEEDATLHIHMHVREDAITLYGFRSQKELHFFELLLTINGVGPKMALEILNEPPQKLQNAIYHGNSKALTSISGVGNKIAERIILELKNKVVPSETDSDQTQKRTEIHGDVFITLENLGYKRIHIQKVLSNMEDNLEDEEDIIRFFLQNV